MPLKLLGKKSWNVYDPKAIEQVKRDEADAARREEEDEQRLEAQDAAIRTAHLRGTTPPKFASPPPRSKEHGPRRSRREDGGQPMEKRRKRIHGEDETDMEMRYAQEDTQDELRAPGGSMVMTERDRHAPIHGSDGHFQLFAEPNEHETRKREIEEGRKRLKQEEAEKRRQNMRFKDAAGFSYGNNQGGKPWYTSSSTTPAQAKALDTMQDKDVWGNEDPRRKERAQARLSSNDPLAAMNAGAAAVRKHEAEKAAWRKQQKVEITQLKLEQECTTKKDDERLQVDSGRGSGRSKHSGDESRGERKHRHSHSHHHRHSRKGEDRQRSRSRSSRHHSHGENREYRDSHRKSHSPRRRSSENRTNRERHCRSRSPRHHSHREERRVRDERRRSRSPTPSLQWDS